MRLAFATLALAAMLVAASIATSTIAVRAVAAAGGAGIVVLGWALLRAARAGVAPAVGLLAAAAVGANDASVGYAVVPIQSAALVAVALLAWWSIDERCGVAGEPGVDGRRVFVTAAVLTAAAGLSALVIAMASVASPGLVGPAVGAVGLASIAAALWSAARLGWYEAERRR